jgi:YidC/Oxa1 family membrane protein insertase
MAESEPGGNNPSPPNQPKELSMEKRLLLAFVLMGAVLFTTPYFFQSANPPAKKTETVPPKSGTGATASDQKKTTAVAAVTEGNAEVPSVPAAAAQKEELFTVDTNVYRVTFSNKGAIVRSWLLKKYFTNGKPLELINTSSTVEFPFSLGFKVTPAADLANALFVAHPEANGLGITYEFSNGRVAVTKKFLFGKDSYKSQILTEVTQDGKPVPHSITWRGGFGDAAVANAAANTWALRFDATEGKLSKDAAKAAKDGPVTNTGTFAFAGIDDQYFAACLMPSEGSRRFDAVTYSDTVPTPLNSKPEPFVGIAVGGLPTNRFDLFVGPKDSDILHVVNPRLDTLIDYGWFTFLAKPLFLALHWTADNITHAYGWAIILVTILINMLLFPLKVSSMRSMKKMQALQPQVNAINEKYKGISMRDPRAQDKNAELMDLYKKNGVNPAGGCLPMALQIPFFIAFYKVLSVSIEMRGAPWLWVRDLSSVESLPIHILPIIMIVTQFFQQQMTPTSAAVDPNQQRMMKFMPLIFGFMFYNLASGVVLYYLTSNLVGIAQQWFFNKTVTAKDLPQPPAAGKKRNGKK